MPTMAAKNLTFYWLNKSNKQLMKLLKVSQAIDLYTKAIELNGQNAVYWANRAFSHTKLEEYGGAIQDASRAIKIDPKYSKVYWELEVRGLMNGTRFGDKFEIGSTMSVRPSVSNVLIR
ncbi:putative protein-serine/threonine phosphatase [Helianthus debilis subsp. tardiflorus]